MNFKFPTQLVSTKQLNLKTIQLFLDKTQKMETALLEKKALQIMQGKIMAALFYEPSTRTRLSFETAFLKLGGQNISVTGSGSSSIKKGETIYDTIKVIENYADVLVMRHAQIGASGEAMNATKKPFINGGDGAGEHPSQSLIDIYTIYKEFGKINGLTIGFVGDVKYSRCIHSLTYLLSNFDVNLVYISPKELPIPDELKNFLEKNKIPFREARQIESEIQNLDVMYVQRMQQERFDDLDQYEKLKNSYVITADLVQKGKKGLIVMDPLPRVGGILTEVDELPQAAYFRQVKNSIPVRMALLDLVMNG